MLDCSSCVETSRKSSFILRYDSMVVNRPIPFTKLHQKSTEIEVSSEGEMEDYESENRFSFYSEQKLSPKLQKDSITDEESTDSRSCFMCFTDSGLIKLNCGHYTCEACMFDMIESKTNKSKVEIAKCSCGCVIFSKCFQDTALEETLLIYLKGLQSYRRLNQQNSISCVVCGFSHQMDETCDEFYKINKKIAKCSVCRSNPEDHLLTCNHSYCSQCMRDLVRHIFENDPFANVSCGVCLNTKTIVPLWMLQSCFGRPSNYIRTQQSYIENGILSPRQQCQICQNQKSMNHFITLGCNHRFCKDCMVGYIENKINEFKVRCDEMNCPLCNFEINSHTIQNCVSPKMYATYLDLTIKKFRPQTPDEKMNWCQKCGFAMTLNIKENFECPQCSGDSFLKFQDGKISKDSENLKPIKSKSKNRKKSKEESFKLPEDVIICPTCSNGCLKESGCNFIECKWPECESTFCNICRTPLRKSEHYSHFGKYGPFSKYCKFNTPS